VIIVGKRYVVVLAILGLIGLIVAVSGCTSNSSTPSNSSAPSVTLTNFTAKGVTFNYPSATWTCVEGDGNTIANLKYKNGNAVAYVKKYPGMSLESLKADVLADSFPNTNVTETSVGSNSQYKGYTIDTKANSPINSTGYYTIFETGGNSYEIGVASETSMSSIVMYIANSIQVT